MMNIPETTGEPSCKRQENGDASTGSERPLKKARFAWQVKGKSKYNLNNESSDPNTSSSLPPDEPEKPEPSQSESTSHNLVGNTEQNLEILGDYLLKQDFNTLDSVTTDPDKSLLKPSTSTQTLHYPRYVSTYESSSASSSMASTSTNYNDLAPMVLTHNNTEEYCIARWQARQMAKGFVDNTINRVLDSWMGTPLPADPRNRVLALDVAEFINNLPDVNTIENEGILMAISAHGLQNSNSNSSSNDDGQIEYENPSPIDDRSKTNSPLLSQLAQSLDDTEMEWSREEPGILPDPSYQNYENNELQKNFEEFDEGTVLDYANNFDFMDAAVNFAIQNKGLTSFGSDYG